MLPGEICANLIDRREHGVHLDRAEQASRLNRQTKTVCGLYLEPTLALHVVLCTWTELMTMIIMCDVASAILLPLPPFFTTMQVRLSFVCQ